jgi:hypothetical protein
LFIHASNESFISVIDDSFQKIIDHPKPVESSFSISLKAKEGGPCKYQTEEGTEITCEKLSTQDPLLIRLEFNFKKASRAHASNHNRELPKFLTKSLARKFIGTMPFARKRSSTTSDINGDITETLCPLEINSQAKYIAGRVEPPKIHHYVASKSEIQPLITHHIQMINKYLFLILFMKIRSQLLLLENDS